MLVMKHIKLLINSTITAVDHAMLDRLFVCSLVVMILKAKGTCVV